MREVNNPPDEIKSLPPLEHLIVTNIKYHCPKCKEITKFEYLRHNVYYGCTVCDTVIEYKQPKHWLED